MVRMSQGSGTFWASRKPAEEVGGASRTGVSGDAGVIFNGESVRRSPVLSTERCALVGPGARVDDRHQRHREENA